MLLTVRNPFQIGNVIVDDASKTHFTENGYGKRRKGEIAKNY